MKRMSLVALALVVLDSLACGRSDSSLSLPPDPGPVELDPAWASQLAGLSLACLDRPYPNKPGAIYDGVESVRPPREHTPAFFGCFDWHSAVHGHWALVTLLKRFPDLPQAAAIRAVLGRHLNADLIAKEAEHLGLSRNATFERPYGWGWLLRLAAALRQWDDPDARRWSEALLPLARLVAERMAAYLEVLSTPLRDGLHTNTAFSLIHVLDYARALGDTALEAAVGEAARRFYGADRDCPLAYEPSGEDFVSPCLTEAELMRQVLSQDEFLKWFAGFLPDASSLGLASVLAPPVIRDLADPRVGHLIGLELERAWVLDGLAGALPPGDPRGELFRRSARVQADAARDQMTRSGYGGEHWLVSFVTLALTRFQDRPRNR